jgi:hypothetical protein
MVDAMSGSAAHTQIVSAGLEKKGRAMKGKLLVAAAMGAASLTLLLNISHGQDNPVPACHPLLMPAECAQFDESLAAAKDPQARHAVETAYQLLIAERERLCPGIDSNVRGEPGPDVAPTTVQAASGTPSL